jgi:hypothetical protein
LPSNFNHVICFLFLDKITIAINGSTWNLNCRKP